MSSMFSRVNTVLNKKVGNIFGDSCTVDYAASGPASATLLTVPVNPAILNRQDIDPTYVVRWCSLANFSALSTAPAAGDKFVIGSKSYTIIEIKADIGDGVYLLLGKEVSAVAP